MSNDNESKALDILRFTPEEIAGVERTYNVKWDEMSELSKVFKGVIYRSCFSPEAIANYVMYGDEVPKKE
jgi:hypothetical protein